MKSNECVLHRNQKDIVNVLNEVEKVAEYNGLTRKETIQLRLLAEEMIGMQEGILGFVEGAFYLENKDRVYNLCLHSDVRVEDGTREKFVELSTNKQNAAYSGFKGKIRMTIDSMLNGASGDIYLSGYDYMGDPLVFSYPSFFQRSMHGEDFYEQTWSLSQYREKVRENEEQWDELEKSIVASIADEVIVGARTNYVDIIVVKKF